MKENKKIQFANRNLCITDENYEKLVCLTAKLKIRSVSKAIDFILSEYLSDDKMKEMLNKHIEIMKTIVNLRFSKNQKIIPPQLPLSKTSARKFFTISSVNLEKIDEISYIQNRPPHDLINEIICDYLKTSLVEN